MTYTELVAYTWTVIVAVFIIYKVGQIIGVTVESIRESLHGQQHKR